MSQFLFRYQPVQPTTWVYLSALVTIGLFFKFSRFWSIRNLDLIMLILLSPGLLMLYFGYQTQVEPSEEAAAAGFVLDANGVTDTKSNSLALGGDPSAADQVPPPPPRSAAAAPWNTPDSAAMQREGKSDDDRELSATARTKRWGYMWLFGCCALWLTRLILDPALVRRPMLAPNLTVGGLAFMGIALFIFLMANVVSLDQTVDPTQADAGVRMDQLMRLKANHGPGYTVLNKLPMEAHKTLVIISHFLIILGLVLIGYRHFGNAGNGFGAAMLYLLLPYTSQLTGRLDHFLPSALLVWAILLYRRPILSGILIGLAAGSTYYPLFLFPVWISFYWRKGWLRFLAGAFFALAAMAGCLMLLPSEAGVWTDLRRMFGIMQPVSIGLEGVWDLSIGGWDPIFRIPMLVACIALCFSFVLWPSRKNLGTLLSCSGAVMLTSQFWIGWSGGLYIAWYLPLVLLVIFRPNLEDRVAQTVLVDGWFGHRRPQLTVAA